MESSPEVFAVVDFIDCFDDLIFCDWGRGLMTKEEECFGTIKLKLDPLIHFCHNHT